jgi:acetyl esterase/lipase
MIVKSLFNTIRLGIILAIVLALSGMASAGDDQIFSREHNRNVFVDDNPDQQCTCTTTPGAILAGVIEPPATPSILYCDYSGSWAAADAVNTATYLPKRVANARIIYDTTDAAAVSYGNLRLPEGNPPPGGWPVVVYIHGGGWTVDYSLDYTEPFLEKLTNEAQVATWSLEFRRLGSVGGAGTGTIPNIASGDGQTGGWPNTFLDVGKGTDYLRTLAATYPLNLNRVIVDGHSSGAHLALWVAGRHKLPPTSDLYVPNPLPLIGVVSQEGLTDLALTVADGRTDVYDLLGTDDPATLAVRYAEASPVELLPFGMPERLIIGAQEDLNYKVQGELNFTLAARAGGDNAEAVLEEGRTGFFDDVVPDAPGWPTEIGAVLSLLRPNVKLTGCAAANWPKN